MDEAAIEKRGARRPQARAQAHRRRARRQDARRRARAPALDRRRRRLRLRQRGRLQGRDADDRRRLAGRPRAARARLLLPRRRRAPRTSARRTRSTSRATLELLGETPKQAPRPTRRPCSSSRRELAGASMTNVELRDPQKVYHRLDLDGLKKLAPDVSWDGYLAAIGFPGITRDQRRAARLREEARRDDQERARSPSGRRTCAGTSRASASPCLSQKFVDEWFHFRQALTGTKTLQPRWKRCVRSPTRCWARRSRSRS